MTKEEAIQRFQQMKKILAIPNSDAERTAEAIDMAIEALKAEPMWIPCSERLPKEKQEVYVTVYFTEGDTGRAYGYIDGFGKWHLCSTVEGTLNSGYEVIAWMPLPEPYKAESEDEE